MEGLGSLGTSYKLGGVYSEKFNKNSSQINLETRNEANNTYK